MGKAFLAVIAVGLVAAFMYRDQVAGGWLDFDLTGPTSVMSGTNSFGSSMSGFGQRMGDAFR
jgi:predicted nuclease of restriction endonuclease-like RecB superfamily